MPSSSRPSRAAVSPGLGHDPSKAPSALASAWAPYAGQQEPQNFPVLLSMAFHAPEIAATSAIWSACSSRSRSTPPSARATSTSPGSRLESSGIDKPGLNGILRLGGALEVPDADLSDGRQGHARQCTRTGTSPIPTPSRVSLAKFINLAGRLCGHTAADANAASGIAKHRGISQPIVPDIANDPDPLITSPLYGRWHALTQRRSSTATARPRRIAPTGCIG